MLSMASSTFVTLLLLMAQLNNAYINYCLPDRGTFINNSTFAINLPRALDALLSNIQAGKFFYNSSYGNAPDEVNAVGLCRGDITSETCRNCLDQASQYLRKRCPKSKEPIVWFEYCMFRYANHTIVGILETYPRYMLWNSVKVLNPVDWSRMLMTLTDRLRADAVFGGSVRKYAAGKIQVPNSKTIYGVLQCTPDLTGSQCDDCLNGILSVKCCSYAVVVLTPSCLLKFDVVQFFNTTADGDDPTASPPETDNHNDSTKSTQGRKTSQSKTIAIIVTSVLGGSFVFITFLCAYMRFRKRKEAHESSLGSIWFSRFLQPKTMNGTVRYGFLGFETDNDSFIGRAEWNCW